MSQITDKLVKGTAWLGVSRAIVNALSVLSTVVLARLLTPADFGLVAIATTMLLVTEVTELSLSNALMRHASPTRSHFDAAWTLNALRGLLLGGLLAAAAFPAARIYGDPRLISVIATLGFGVFLSGLANPRIVVLQRELVFWQDFVMNVAQKFAGVVASIVIAFVYQTYWALILGTLLMQVTNVLVSYLIMPYRPRVTFAHSRELMSFSLWLTAGQIANTLNWRFDSLLVGKTLGAAPLGFYSVGSNFAMIPTRETTAPLIQTIFPGFSSIQNDRVRLAAAYQRAQAVITAVALPAGIGSALVADPVLRLALGAKWEPVIFIVQALASVFALQTLGSLVQPLAMAKGETRLLFIRSLQMLLVRVPVVFAGMLMYGLKGVVIARVLSGLIAIYFNMNLASRLTGLGILKQLAANSRALASAVVMAAGVMLASPLFSDATDARSLVIKIVVNGALAAALYCGTTWLLWLMMRKPNGPEQELGRLVAKLLTKFIGAR